MIEPLIKCEHVDFGYENQDAVVDVNMEVCPGDYLCIVGENGSGKSTLMKGLLGLLKPLRRGTYGIRGIKAHGNRLSAPADGRPEGFPGFRTGGCLKRLLKPQGTQALYSRTEKAVAAENMERLGIMPLAKQCYRELSGGQQQRVLIARALCATTRLLILDEPITGLDPMAIQDFYAMIRRLNREDGVAILMVSHDLRNAVEEANKILHLQKQVLFTALPTII